MVFNQESRSSIGFIRDIDDMSPILFKDFFWVAQFFVYLFSRSV